MKLCIQLYLQRVLTHGHIEVKTQFTACKANIVSIWHGAEVAKAHSQPFHISPEPPPPISYPWPSPPLLTLDYV